MEIDKIVGGLTCNSRSIVYGGKEFTVGEAAKWNMRNKLLLYKHSGDPLKIIGIKPRISFGSSKVNHTEEDLKKRYNETTQDVIDRLVLEYKLYSPYVKSMIDMIKFLVEYLKVKQPIKVSPKLYSVIQSEWDCVKYLKLSIDKPIINDIPELIENLMDKITKKSGNWTEPDIIHPQYPRIPKRAKKKMTNKKTVDHVYELLMIENDLIDTIEEIENYYIEVAKNNYIILDSLREYLSTP